MIFTALVLFFSGILIAFLSVMVGIGGGILIVPFLTLIMDIDPTTATLISSFVIFFTSLMAFSRYHKQGKVDLKTAVNFVILTIPGSILGGYIAQQIDPSLLKSIFGVFVVISAIRGILKSYLSRNDHLVIPENLDIDSTNYRKLVDDDGTEFEYMVDLKLGRWLAFLGGFLAGLLGIGGGIIFVPVLNSFTGVPIHIAAPTSVTLIVVSSFVSVITRFTLVLREDSEFDWVSFFKTALPLVTGTVIGARIGPSKVKKVNSKTLILMFWIVAFAAGVRMLIG